MVRTQIQLTEKQAEAVKQAAARLHLSVAEVIRRVIDRSLGTDLLRDEDEVRRRALAAAGRFRTKENDVARRHDDYLIEAYES